jgi:hypothetical protein
LLRPALHFWPFLMRETLLAGSLSCEDGEGLTIY